MKKEKKESAKKKRTEVVISNPQDTKEPESKPKCVLLDEFDNFKTGEKDILTTLSAPRICRELIQWAFTDPEAIKVKQFLAEKGICDRTWNRWCQKHEDIGKAHHFAKMIIGNRREHGMITRKYEPSQTAKNMWMYDDDWKISAEFWANLSEKGITENNVKYIIMPEVPDSPLVPKRKVEDE